MPRHTRFVPHGVIPAVLLPFFDDLSIDEANYRAHLRDVTSPKRSAYTTAFITPPPHSMHPIIDAHHHSWRPADLPWLSGPELPRIYKPT